jgi:hypothetical protein
MGSAYEFLEAPDFNQERITPASVELSGRAARESAGAAWSGYAPESRLLFRCGLYGFRRATGRAKVDAQVVLFRQGKREPWLDTGPAPVPEASLAENFVAGQLDLASLPAGEYTLQLMLWDRLADSKYRLAVRWARFVVAGR